MSTRPEVTPLGPPRGSRWHSSHFLDNSHNAVGGYSNKGGTAPGHKTLKAADGRDSSGCPRFTGSRGSRQIKAVGRADGARRLTYSFRFVTWHAGMRDNYSKMRARCGRTRDAISPACSTRGTARARVINPRRKIRRFAGETEIDSREETWFRSRGGAYLRAKNGRESANDGIFWLMTVQVAIAKKKKKTASHCCVTDIE